MSRTFVACDWGKLVARKVLWILLRNKLELLRSVICDLKAVLDPVLYPIIHAQVSTLLSDRHILTLLPDPITHCGPKLESHMPRLLS